ncbi:MAG: FeoA family protein [Candidatus Hatepunaea meridiana]|nr:FeoA family protein [Candidatus Hatepunaea meridiana]
MPLTMVQIGKRVRLVGIDAGRRLRARLADMGLIPGVEIDIISNSSRGPFIVAVKGSRVVLGHGMAMKILVE